jgi:HK97 family phage major capsid protein
MALSIEDAEKILELQDQILKRVEEGKAEIAKIGERTGETEAAIKRIDAAWTEVETKAKRPAQGSGAPSSDEEAALKLAKREAFKSYLKQGFMRMAKDEQKLLLGSVAAEEDMRSLQNKARELRSEFKAFSISDDTLGGYFVLPEIVQNEVIKASILYSPVRGLARIQPTNQNTVEIRVRTATLAAQWVAETGTRAETLGEAYGKVVIPTHEMYAFVLFSRQLLEDEYFSLETDVQADIAEQFGVTEGAAFVTGDGNGKPLGFLANVAAGNVQTAAGASAILYADVVKVFHKLKPAYRNSPNCQWVFNQNTLSAIRQIVDTTGRPILQAFADSGLNAANPNTILGKPYVEATDMPDIATGKRTMAVGDFSKGYRFVDRVQMSVQRLEELFAASGQVGILVHKRVGGQVVLAEALAALQQA